MFRSIVNLCEKHGFLKKVVLTKLKLEQFKAGPVGKLLLHNLQREWFLNVVINKDLTVFLSEDDDFEETFQYARKACMEHLPFGVAEIIRNKRLLSDQQMMDYYTEKINNRKEVDYETSFDTRSNTLLKCTVFISPTNALPFFHQWQRQRRVWWRKFSPNPGRYSLTDIKTDEKNIQSVQILADYSWKPQVVETLYLYPQSNTEKLKNGKKSVSCHSVVSTINLDVMFLNTLCDAYDDATYKNIQRTLMRFHRKLAPYSISFALSTSNSLSELKDLALYLTRQLRNNHVSTLLLPSASKLTLEAQWRQYDELGVPYNVLLNEKTLKDGLVHLRSRDTTLKEQVHVTELVEYVNQLFKTY